MLLEVLTRHHPGRRGLLERCQASLDGQTDDDWQQTVLVDEMGWGVAWANHALARYAEHLEGEYIWVLDDDDVCVCDELVADVRRIVERVDPDVIFARMDHFRHGILPDDGFWGEAPAFAHIAMSCFVLRRSVYQQHADAFRVAVGADFRMARAVFEGGHRVFWHDRVVARCERQSFGAAE